MEVMKEIAKRVVFLGLVVVIAAMFGACAKPKVELSVSQPRIKQGESVSVNWKTQNSKEILLNGQTVGKTGTQVFQPTDTTTYELIGKRGKNQAKDSKTVTVEVISAQPAITFTAEPSVIEQGKQSRLRWTTQNASSVEIPGIGTFGASGETPVAPLDSTTYTATARGEGGTVSASTRVTVTMAARTGDNGTTTVANNDGEAEFVRNVRSIFFDFDKSDLRPEAITTLQQNAQFLLREPYRSIVFRIEGNCDPRGSEEYNLALGDRRANTAKTYLISQGIDPTRIDILSNGKRNAQGTSEGSPNSPPSWANDRRDDFKYIRGGTLRPEPNK